MQKSQEDTSQSCRRHLSDAAWLRFALNQALQFSGVSALSLALFKYFICEAIEGAVVLTNTQHLGLAI